jgi:hypothetical protein
MVFIGGDPSRFWRAAHDLSLKATSPSDETAANATPNAAQNEIQDENITISPAGGQSTVAVQIGGLAGFAITPAVVVPSNLTALFKPQQTLPDQALQSMSDGAPPDRAQVDPASATVANRGFLAQPADPTPVAETAAVGVLPGIGVDSPYGPGQTKLLLPEAAGLLAEAVPLDQATLGKAVDRFFDQLEALDAGQLAEFVPSPGLRLSLALLGTAAAAELTRRRLKSKAGSIKPAERQNPLSSEELRGYPELPGSWSTYLT